MHRCDLRRASRALTALLALATFSCNRSSEVTASADPAATVATSSAPEAGKPITVDHVKCPVVIPSDSEVTEAKVSSFTVRPKGETSPLGTRALVVNLPSGSIYSKTIDPDATDLVFTVDEKRDDGFALEGTFTKSGRKYWFVHRSIPCAPDAWLVCNQMTIYEKHAAYTSRVCKGLVPGK